MNIRRQRTPVGDGNCFCCSSQLFFSLIRRQRTPVGDGNNKNVLKYAILYYQKIENPSRGRKLLYPNICYYVNQKIENPSRGRKQDIQFLLYQHLHNQKIENPSRGRKLTQFICLQLRCIIRRQRTPVGDGNNN